MKTQSIIQKIVTSLFVLIFFLQVNNLKSQYSLTASFTYTNGPNGQVYFTSTSTGTNSNTIFRWNFARYPNYYGIFNGTSLTTYTQTFSNNTTYLVYHGVVNTQPSYCADSTFQLITINNATCSATTSFSLQQVPNQSFTWNAVVIYPTNVSGVTWRWGDGSTSNSLFPTHTYAFAGYYNICLTVSTTCGGIYTACTYSNLNKPSKDEQGNQIITLNIIQGTPTNLLEDNKRLEEISVFPNPNNSSFYIDLKNIAVNKQVQISISNLLGEEIYSDSFVTGNGSEPKKIELGDVKSGTYFIKTPSDNEVKVTKLLIVK